MLKVKYFGMIAEKAGKTEEILQLEKVGNTIEEVRAYCVKEYDLGSVPTFQIALNQSITQSGKLIPGDEVAFLPPFAGG